MRYIRNDLIGFAEMTHYQLSYIRQAYVRVPRGRIEIIAFVLGARERIFAHRARQLWGSGPKLIAY